LFSFFPKFSKRDSPVRYWKTRDSAIIKELLAHIPQKNWLRPITGEALI
jgi:hypothetical protein